MIKGFHREGRVFLVLSTATAFLLLWGTHHLAGNSWPFYLALVFCLVWLYLFFQFFRIPARSANLSDNSLISPCDGKVVVIEEVMESEFLNTRCRQISIFMSPLNVHINWYPAGGEVLYQKYHPGKFLVAWHPKSSTDNERTTVVVRNPKGDYVMRQIAGAVARRIRCYAQQGQTARQSHEMGFIKFGSRVDLFIPLEAEVKVAIGDKVQGLRTPIASW